MPTSYDEIPYPGSPYSQTHPDRLATLAILFGMTPAPVERCRVLELGCGDGGNIIPMAFGLPDSRFTGVDLAESAIVRGQELIAGLQLDNVELHHLDLMDFDPRFGEFDYIIAHGLYSWVPPQVREKILDICKSHLAAQGIAFVSYNTYPGGHLLDTIREMMQFHVRNVASPHERLRQSRELLEFLVEAHPDQDVHGALLRQELKLLLERKPEFFYHDELSEHNHRFYFYEFVEQAGRYGLQFLSEAQLLSMQTDAFGPQVAEKIRTFSGGDELAREQYLDFLKLRNFRQTLLCRSEGALDRRLRPACVARMFAASDARPALPEPDLTSTSALQFNYPNGGSMSTNHPLAKAAMMHLGRVWPQALPFSELLRTARALSRRDTSAGAPLEEDATWLSDMVVKLYAANFLELHVHAPAFVTKPSARPVSSALARAQVERGSTVTSLRHSSVEVEDEAARQLLTMLDGTRDREQLLLELRQRANSGEITAESLETNLDRLGRLALLVA
ncbi:MAG TPA: class I SAM-dependent methyltransferase [Bryobacteraceae bacterium]|nr:class I SAM-dependent methyltransferase [Bryobacteraceae bacterium]